MILDLLRDGGAGDEQAKFNIECEGVFRQVRARQKKLFSVRDRALDMQNTRFAVHVLSALIRRPEIDVATIRHRGAKRSQSVVRVLPFNAVRRFDDDRDFDAAVGGLNQSLTDARDVVDGVADYDGSFGGGTYKLKECLLRPPQWDEADFRPGPYNLSQLIFAMRLFDLGRHQDGCAY